MLVLKKLPRKIPKNIGFTPILGEKKIIIISTASGALVVGGVRDIYSGIYSRWILDFGNVIFFTLRADLATLAKTMARPPHVRRPTIPLVSFQSLLCLNSLLFCLISTVLWGGATSICDGIIIDIIF